MSYLYKLTDENGDSGLSFAAIKTHWDVGVRHSIEELDNKVSRSKNAILCTRGYIHAYENPLIAVVMNPTHANFQNPILWKATGWVVRRGSQLKCGCYSLKIVERLSLPEVSIPARVHFAILCSLEFPQEPSYTEWANNWLAGKDRAAAYAAVTATAATAAAAATAAYSAATAAAYAAVAAARVAAAYAAATAGVAAYYTQYTKINYIKLLQTAIRKEQL
jgi:hypothetical protein